MREYFEDCRVGDRAVSSSRTMTETDVVMFAALTGDWNPIHTDAEFAKKTPFGERIAHGLLTLVTGTGLMVRMGVGELLPRELVAVVGLEKVRFVGPVKLGDTIHVESEIAEVKPMGNEFGLIDVRFRIKNQNDEPVLTGRFKMQARRRPE